MSYDPNDPKGTVNDLVKVAEYDVFNHTTGEWENVIVHESHEEGLIARLEGDPANEIHYVGEDFVPASKVKGL
jgi:hypothetical protein